MTTNPTLAPILNQAIADVVNLLNEFADDSLFAEKFNLAFGVNITPQAFKSLIAVLPEIEIVENGELQGALGAFSAQTGKIYLSASFLNIAPSASIVNVILEEIGHYVDAQINHNDTPGDEGEYFSVLVRGVDLTAEEVERITNENDFANIMIAGNDIPVEKSAPIILTVNTTADQNDGSATNGLSLRDAILIANANTTNDYIIELQGGQTYFLTQGNSSPLILNDENAAKTG